MAKRRKQDQRPARAKPKAFNAPFAGLAKALKDAPPPEAAPAAAPPPEEPSPADGMAFVRAMADVTPMGDRDKLAVLAAPKAPAIPLAPDDDLEVMAHLADLVSGAAEPDLRHAEGYLEGRMPGVADDLMERLRDGAFPIQDHLDLHGLSADDARADVERFVGMAAAKGMRHVLIVHGKGLSSPGGLPVIKNQIPGWLGGKRLRRHVLAFCTARGHDGGRGALYVLLRKWAGPGRGRTFI